MEGICIHADVARVNINVWVVPDEANLDSEGGGLVVYSQRSPLWEADGSEVKRKSTNSL